MSLTGSFKGPGIGFALWESSGNIWGMTNIAFEVQTLTLLGCTVAAFSLVRVTDWWHVYIVSRLYVPNLHYFLYIVKRNIFLINPEVHLHIDHEIRHLITDWLLSLSVWLVVEPVVCVYALEVMPSSDCPCVGVTVWHCLVNKVGPDIASEHPV